MLTQWKSSLKACLKPLYYRLPGPLLRTIRRWREEQAQRRDAALAGGPPPVDVLLQHLEESDRLLLAAVKLAQAAPPTPTFAPVALGNGRVLAPHPAVPFVYLDANDLTETPFILAGRFEVGVTSVLERLVRPGDHVLELGAGQGYHTLALAALVGPSGSVVVPEPWPAVLRENVTAHRLGVVTPTQSGRIDVVRIGATAPVDEAVTTACQALDANADVRVLCSGHPHVIEPLMRRGLSLWRVTARGDCEPTRLDDLTAPCDVVAARHLD